MKGVGPLAVALEDADEAAASSDPMRRCLRPCWRQESASAAWAISGAAGASGASASNRRCLRPTPDAYQTIAASKNTNLKLRMPSRIRSKWLLNIDTLCATLSKKKKVVFAFCYRILHLLCLCVCASAPIMLNVVSFHGGGAGGWERAAPIAIYP